MSTEIFANESVNDLIQDPNNYFVFSTFSAFPNVTKITEDPNDRTFISSFFCYGCHQTRHILGPSDPNNNLWREAGAAPIYGDQVDGKDITNNTKRRNHHLLYCNNCHKTPPDPNDIYHSNLANTNCDTCHLHNGIYEGNPAFYKHVNGKVDFITIQISFPAGWSMISLPMLPDHSSTPALFPEAIVIYKHERESGYVRVKRNEDLQIGYGYWILFNKAQKYMISARAICSYNKTVHNDGWKMIGGCTFQAMAFAENCNIKIIYRYVQGKGYIWLLDSENLMPGEGYWILIEDVSNIMEKAVLTIKPAGF